MPKMHCNGDMTELDDNIQVCPLLTTNFVPVGMKCKVQCKSGTPSVTQIKCDEKGWNPTNQVSCAGNSAGMIVGLLFGGIVVVVIIAYGYARWNSAKKARALNNGKNPSSTSTRAAKIAEENDMIASGQAFPRPPSSEAVPRMKIVSGIEEEDNIPPNTNGRPPSYNSYMAEHDIGQAEPQRTRQSRRSHESRHSHNESRHSSHRSSGNYYDNNGYHNEQYPAEYEQEQQHQYPSHNGGHNMHSGGYYQEDMGGYPAERYERHHRPGKPYDVPI